mmetsp:Transcript_7256/g.9807  ORF Transcript_7256/g.9807 Transcript_7256/m.9807 type:complete len:218 (-) Transcript_7256:224-877(-)|eukprot:CAMPEP_0196571308 /NCGR_PEP_ID=MMETSP1081-20130531/1492_1 /TAXON_ID=36882 /ORGANISM="Pyramimonas amylifera, Strain CCMP720" /LENGTH=217 /DNA_ID=CAMNT_0041888195 /DNA_START=103 /DNA_END=756 /DNA_ORIENTATION=+
MFVACPKPIFCKRLINLRTNTFSRGLSAQVVRQRPRSLQIRSELGDVKRTGIIETSKDGVITAEFSFDLGGPTAAKDSLSFQPGSEFETFVIPRPLGIIFEEKILNGEKCCVAEELVEGGNAEAKGVKVGDILRCTTGVFTVKGNIDVSTWMNPPKNTNVLAYFFADGKPFDQVMEAIVSNGQLIDTPRGKREIESVSLIVERAKLEEINSSNEVAI